jgi:hypothetical protein
MFSGMKNIYSGDSLIESSRIMDVYRQKSHGYIMYLNSL